MAHVAAAGFIGGRVAPRAGDSEAEAVRAGVRVATLDEVAALYAE